MIDENGNQIEYSEERHKKHVEFLKKLYPMVFSIEKHGDKTRIYRTETDYVEFGAGYPVSIKLSLEGSRQIDNSYSSGIVSDLTFEAEGIRKKKMQILFLKKLNWNMASGSLSMDVQLLLQVPKVEFLAILK